MIHWKEGQQKVNYSFQINFCRLIIFLKEKMDQAIALALQ